MTARPDVLSMPRKGQTVRNRNTASLTLALIIAGGFLVPIATGSPALAASASTTAPAGTQLRPIEAMVLADESGSESPTDIGYEREAAVLLMTSELSPQSSFSVAGFGSSNGPGETAVDTYCPFIPVNSALNVQRLATCADQIQARTQVQGWDTDHAAALLQAVDALNSTGPATEIKVIFLMTDGVLDVHNSSQYGPNQAQRTPVALQEIQQQILPAAKRDGIQIWPLGFGSEINQLGPAGLTGAAMLSLYAQGGAGANQACSSQPGAAPHALIVNSSVDTVLGLLSELSRAQCTKAPATVSGRTTPGKSLTLTVDIPPVATDGSITVIKVDPLFGVSFIDPAGVTVPVTGVKADGQVFSLAGQQQRIEALRIQDPLPGLWKIVVSDPIGHPAQTVSATVIWQGALAGAISATPVQPQPGSSWDIQIQVLTRSGFETNPTALSYIHATAQIAGSFGTKVVPLSYNAKQADGVFSGSVVLPKTAKGNLEACGRLSGAGLAADRRCLFTSFITPLGVTALISFPAGTTVHPGGNFKGTVTVYNQGAAQSGTLVLGGLSGNEQVTISPSQVAMPTGQHVTDFVVQFGATSPTGSVPGIIQVLDQNGRNIGETFIGAQVTPVPKPASKTGTWAAIAVVVVLLVLLVLALIAIRDRRKADRASVKDLSARLVVDGVEKGEDWRAPRTGDQFYLALVPDEDNPRIRRGSPEDFNIVVRRAGERLERLAIQGHSLAFSIDDFDSEIDPGHQIQLNDSLSLIVRDNRRVRLAPTGPDIPVWPGSESESNAPL